MLYRCALQYELGGGSMAKHGSTRVVLQSVNVKNPLSLVAGDPLHRLLQRMRLLSNDTINYWRVLPLVVVAGWFIPCALSAIEGNLLRKSAPESFLLDPNIYVQNFVVILLLYAERFIDERIVHAGILFSRSGILAKDEEYSRAEIRMAKLRTNIIPDIVALTLASVFALMWVVPAIHAGVTTWMVHYASGHWRLTWAGVWTATILSPLFEYLWLRWVWKVFIWIGFLSRMARADMRLAVGHPDRVGGLAFIGDVQAGFGILIFALGLVVASNVFRELVVVKHGTPLILVSNIGGFVILAPLVFLLPLLMFTKKIYTAKQIGLVRYNILLTEFINAFEAKFLPVSNDRTEPLRATADLAALSNIETLHSHVASMRIVPFDLLSFGRLMLAAASPMAPIVVRFVPWPTLREIAAAMLRQ